MKNILVTGATGCIGSNLTARLVAAGYNVRILCRPTSAPGAIRGIEVARYTGDVRDPASIDQALRGCDTVFHCAALVSFRRQLYDEQYDVNVLGTRNVAEACRKAEIEMLVHTSSVAAIGYRMDGGLADEETAYNWKQVPGYRYSKYCAEEEVRKAIRNGVRAVIVNPSVVIGERDVHFHGGQIVRDIRKGRIPAYIDGGMNVVYVGDVVNGQIAAALCGRIGDRYILSGENLTHKEIFRRTASLIGGHAPMVKLPLPLLRTTSTAFEWGARLLRTTPLITRDMIEGAGRNNWFSCNKAERELGYTVTSFDDAIVRTYEWYKENGMM